MKYHPMGKWAVMLSIGLSAVVCHVHASSGDEIEIPWSVEIAADQDGALLFKIDARNIVRTQASGFKDISFEVAFHTKDGKESSQLIPLNDDVVAAMQIGNVYGTYVKCPLSDVDHVTGKVLNADLKPPGESADGVAVFTVKKNSSSHISASALPVGKLPVPTSAQTVGNLLWYKDAHRDGTGQIMESKTIGFGGWQNFKSVFAGGDGIIYAITNDGDLLYYKDAHRDGTGELKESAKVGSGGWQNFRTVFSGGKGILYAITNEGDLLFYKDARGDGSGEFIHPKTLGVGAWQNFKTVFPGGNGIIYAITNDGDLLWYRDMHRDGTGEVKDPKTIGRGGWQNFKTVFSGDKGIIYAITTDGNLLFYKDEHQNGTGEVTGSKTIGFGGWQNFKVVFCDEQGNIYAITPG